MSSEAALEDSNAPTWRGRDPLAWLLAPQSLDGFLSSCWEHQPLILYRDNSEYYRELLTFYDIDEFMSRNDIRYPYLRIVKDGKELPLVDYADDFVYGNNIFPGLLDNDKVFHHYAQGATLSFQIFQKCMRELSLFCNALEARLRFQTQVNIFVTPPGSKGFTAHYDDHSFFIFQISGKKHWKLYGNPVELPIQEFRNGAVMPDLGDPREITLAAGDLLYLPRGFYHEAHTTDETSVHITLGVFPFTWLQILQRLVDRAKQDVEYRRAPGALLQLGVTPEILQDEFEALWKKLGSTSVDPLFRSLYDQAASKQIVDSRRRLSDLAALASLNDGSWIFKRPVLWNLYLEHEYIRLTFYDKAIRFPAAVEETLREILNSTRFQPCGLLSNIDPISRLNVVRKLIKEGMLGFENS